MNEAWDIAAHFANMTGHIGGPYLKQNYDCTDIVRLNNLLINASKSWLEKQYVFYSSLKVQLLIAILLDTSLWQRSCYLVMPLSPRLEACLLQFIVYMRSWKLDIKMPIDLPGLILILRCMKRHQSGCSYIFYFEVDILIWPSSLWKINTNPFHCMKGFLLI